MGNKKAVNLRNIIDLRSLLMEPPTRRERVTCGLQKCRGWQLQILALSVYVCNLFMTKELCANFADLLSPAHHHKSTFVGIYVGMLGRAAIMPNLGENHRQLIPVPGWDQQAQVAD